VTNEGALTQGLIRHSSFVIRLAVSFRVPCQITDREFVTVHPKGSLSPQVPIWVVIFTRNTGVTAQGPAKANKPNALRETFRFRLRRRNHGGTK